MASQEFRRYPLMGDHEKAAAACLRSRELRSRMGGTLGATTALLNLEP